LDFFLKAREKYLTSLPRSIAKRELEKLARIDNEVKAIIKTFNNQRQLIRFVKNNKLSTYVIFLQEIGELNISLPSYIIDNAYHRFYKLLNTLGLLNKIGIKVGKQFMLIKSLNVIPYLPVYDIDIYDPGKTVLNNLGAFLEHFVVSSEREANKLNLIPKDQKYFKLSFHFDITWDGVKVHSLEPKNYHLEQIELYSNISFNTPKLESIIRLQECVLERLHINFIDYLFFKNYLDSNFDIIDIRQCISDMLNPQKFPYFVRYKCILKSHLPYPKLLLKNSLRHVLWRVYYKVTGNAPFHE
jgi:hypothetical protein